jgi:Ca2+-binding RTX toxin-like protein
MTFAYQWYRCTGTDLPSCTVAISGETATTYLLRSEDLDKFIRVLVTASNSLGTAAEYSQPTDQVATAAPVNVVPPSITGTTRVGLLVTAAPGSWTGTPTPTFTYTWQRCNSDGTGCANIPGATSSSYTIVAADAGKKLQVSVRATNTAGTSTVTALATDVVLANPPVNSSRPTISGLARVGSVLSATAGTWTGTPTPTFTYQWKRCDADGENCVVITGATASTYIPTAADVNRTILVTVTATNTGGLASVDSLETTAVTSSTSPGAGTATRPANTSVPRITGTAAKNSLLVATPGSWSGTTPMTFSYQWQRCTTTTTCTSILRATLSTYRPVQEDVGKRLRVVVTAGNGVGSATANSAVTDIVKATGPVSSVGITRRGTAKNDRLVGTARNDTLLGLAGNDTLFGRAGADTLRGGVGKDALLGEAGADALYGDAGNDTITGGAGRDRIFGGVGNETINALDGEIDDVDCGAGRDAVRADKLDRLRNCERVTRATFKKAATKKKAAAKKKAAPKKAKAVARKSSASSSSSLVDAVNSAIAWAGRR